MDPYYESIKDDRNEWAGSRPQRCMNCGCGDEWPGLQIHEIERRSHAYRNWAQRCNYLLLCQECHDDEFATMPHVDQLALKKLADPEFYDLQAWLSVGGRHSGYITEDEVTAAIIRGTRP